MIHKPWISRDTLILSVSGTGEYAEELPRGADEGASTTGESLICVLEIETAYLCLTRVLSGVGKGSCRV